MATVLLVALGCSLSYWQTQRAHQKERIEIRLKQREVLPPINLPPSVDIAQMEYTRVKLIGEFISDWPVYLDNRPMNGMAGIVVMMPFKPQGSAKFLLIARGWLPRNSQNRGAIKSYPTPSGIIQIEGTLKANSGHIMELAKPTPLAPKELIQNLDVDAFIRASNLPTYPFIVEQTNNTGDGLLRDWPRASMGSDRHRGYAFQWLALAVMAILFFIVTGFKHGRKAD